MRKLVAVLTSLVVLSLGAVILTTHAADQKPTAPPAAAPTAPAATAKPNTPKAAPPGAPQVPEESATIRDDPTIAPDPKQSADNNVSFPNDI
jgi:hypothetical protein